MTQIIAEIGANHGGKESRARELVEAARGAGAAAVKLQTWAPGKMVLDPSIMLRDGPWAGMNLSALYEEANLPWEIQRQVFAYARELGIECFSSVFDRPSLDFLEQIGCPRYKVASFELVDLPLIYAIAKTKKPIILSTGMAEFVEIEQAVQTAREGGCKDITLLKCSSAYPADGAAANLRTMAYLRERLQVAVGLSDHTPGIGVAIVAVAHGAEMIEKHLTLRQADGGLDAEFSIVPSELAALVEEAKRVARCLGTVAFGPTVRELPQLALRRSLYFAEDIAAGTYLGERHVVSARPAKGLAPRYIGRILGSKTARDVRAGEPVLWDAIEERKLVVT